MNFVSSVAVAQKGLKTVITKNGPSLDLSQCCIEFSRSDYIDHLDLVIAKESKNIVCFL